MGNFLPFFSILGILFAAPCTTTGNTAYPDTPVIELEQPLFSEEITEEPVLSESPPDVRYKLLEEAVAHLYTPYQSPPHAPRTFDCSTFVSYVYSKFGYVLPRTSSAYGTVGTRIDWKDAKPGDILVFGRVKGSTAIDHVALLWKKSDTGELAGSWIIHAASINTGASMLHGNPNTKTGVVITELGLRGDGITEKEYFLQRFSFCTRVLDD